MLGWSPDQFFESGCSECEFLLNCPQDTCCASDAVSSPRRTGGNKGFQNGKWFHHLDPRNDNGAPPDMASTGGVSLIDVSNIKVVSVITILVTIKLVLSVTLPLLPPCSSRMSDGS